jgi:nucleoid-associated protein YgaU
MLSPVATIRNLFLLLAALALATGCTTAKTLGTPVSAVAATAAPSSDTGVAEVAEATTDTDAAEVAEATTDTDAAEVAEATTDTDSAEVAEATTDTDAAEVAEATTDTDAAEVAEATTDTDAAEVAEATTDTDAAEVAEATTDTGVAEASEALAPESWVPSPLTLWVVHKGEHLWGISAHDKVYGDPYQWPLLFKRNRHQIEDADLVYPGQVLHIERDLSNAEIDRAIEHAKTRGAWILGITELTDLEYLSRERGYE